MRAVACAYEGHSVAARTRAPPLPRRRRDTPCDVTRAVVLAAAAAVQQSGCLLPAVLSVHSVPYLQLNGDTYPRPVTR